MYVKLECSTRMSLVKKHSMAIRITLTQLMLFVGAGLFYRDELIPSFIVLAVYVLTLIMVLRQSRDDRRRNRDEQWHVSPPHTSNDDRGMPLADES